MNEKSFFEVFHNQYLFKKILEEIETTEWFIYDDYRQYSIYNRRKFKYIKDLSWMVEKKQFELLKCKLINNEELNITEKGLELLFSRYEEFNVTKLFLNKWISIKDSFNLYKISIGVNNFQVVKLLAEEFKLPLDLGLLNYSIETNTANKVLVAPPLPDSQEKRQKQLHQLKEQEDINSKRDDIISYILENQLDNIKSSTFNNSNSPPLVSILYIKSNSLRERLLELNYFEIKRSSFESQCAFVKNINYSIESIIFLFKVYFKCARYNQIPTSTQDEINEIIQNLELNETGKEIELLLLLLRESESKKLDSFIRFRYGERNDENQDGIGYKEINNGSIYSCKDLIELINTNENGSNDEKIIEFIFNYTSQKLHKYDFALIRKAVFLMNNEENYKKAIDSIVNCKAKFNLTDPIIEWHPNIKDIMIYNSDSLVIQNTSIIDWIQRDTTKGLVNLKGEYIDKRRGGKISFKNYELAEYSRQQIEVHFPIMQTCPVTWNQIIENPLSLTLNKLNIKPQSSPEPLLENLSDQDFVRVINCMNQDFQGNQFEFRSDLLRYIFNNIKQRYCSESNTNIQVLNQFRMNNLFILAENESSILLIDAIVKYNLTATEFICNNFNLSESTNSFQFEWDNDSFSFFRPTANPLFTPDDICTTRDVTFDQVIKPFKYWVDKTQAALQTDNQSYINVVLLILNHYYKRLIQIQGISFESVIKAREMLVEVGLDPLLVLRHSLYESFYYLNIKSPKLIKYVMSKRKFQETLALNVAIQFIKFYDCNFQYDFFEPSTNILHYLDPSVFTLEYILNSTFDEILKRLVDLPDPDRNMEDELIYYLDIKRMDLFLSEFTKFIQSNSSDPNKIQLLINSNNFNYSVFYISSIGLIKDYIELVIQFLNNNNSQNNNQPNSDNNININNIYSKYLEIINSTHKYDVYDYFVKYFKNQ